MYKVVYKEDQTKDTTYDDAYYCSLNNDNKKWANYYCYLKEKYDLCHNVDSVIIDISDIKMMKFDAFSNDVLLKLYSLCVNEGVFSEYDTVTIPNSNHFTEELIYNIFKAEWLIDERLFQENQDELKRRKNYFQAMVEVSDSVQDIKIQFRNKLYEYFLTTYEMNKDNYIEKNSESKVLKLDNKKLN